MPFLLSAGAIVGVSIGGLFLILIVSLLFWFVAKRNLFKRMEVKIEESASDIDVALTKRYDLLTKEYDVCKGYSKHENATLSEVTRMRQNPRQDEDGNIDIERLSRLNHELDLLSRDIHLTVEQYPDLKANALFLNLMETSKQVENHLESTRRIYNSNVARYNEEIVIFPSSIVAHMIHAKKRGLFQAEEKKKDDVSLKF